jgi:flagellin-like hook-associated protein FlgL
MFINPEIGFDRVQALGYATEKNASISLQRLSSGLRCKISFGGCLQE